MTVQHMSATHHDIIMIIEHVELFVQGLPVISFTEYRNMLSAGPATQRPQAAIERNDSESDTTCSTSESSTSCSSSDWPDTVLETAPAAPAVVQYKPFSEQTRTETSADSKPAAMAQQFKIGTVELDASVDTPQVILAKLNLLSYSLNQEKQRLQMQMHMVELQQAALAAAMSAVVRK